MSHKTPPRLLIVMPIQTVYHVAGRRLLVELRRRRAAVIQIQRIARGRLARKYVQRIKALRHEGAVRMQCLWRQYWAKKVAFRKRHERNAATQIQRVYRGHLGR